MAYLLHNHRPFCCHTACVAGLQQQDAIEAAIGARLSCGYRTLRDARAVVAKVNKTDFAGFFSIKAGACPESVR